MRRCPHSYGPDGGTRERPETVLERNQPGTTREPKQWRPFLAKFENIDPKDWAEHGVKPIRNVPKEFQAQY